MATNKTLQVEVFQAYSGIVTAIAKNDDGAGFRLCGIKLPGSGSIKIAEFQVDRAALTECIELLGDEDPEPCRLCHSEPHDTLCESCSIPVCYGCSISGEDCDLCNECVAKLKDDAKDKVNGN
jgi:hypothetical protein